MSSKETPLTYFGSLVFDDAVKWANAFVWFRYQYCNIYSSHMQSATRQVRLDSLDAFGITFMANSEPEEVT